MRFTTGPFTGFEGAFDYLLPADPSKGVVLVRFLHRTVPITTPVNDLEPIPGSPSDAQTALLKWMRVRITSGPFEGLEGAIVERNGERGTLTLAVRFVHQTVRISIDDAEGEVLDIPASETAGLLDVAVAPLGNELIRHLAKHPDEMYSVSPRRFEEVIAELLRDMGHDVFVTPESHDGGRDILAVMRLPAYELLTVVDCKRYALDRPIGPDIVQRLLWVAEKDDRASHAVLATTSRFTKGAIELANDYRWRLTLRDFAGISAWLERYGSWRPTGDGGIWLPSEPPSELKRPG